MPVDTVADRVQGRAVKPEFFRLTSKESGISESSDSTCENFAIRYTYAPIWKFQVPIGQEYILTNEHKVCVYLEDDEASSAEWLDTQKVRVVIWDANLRKMEIIKECRYVETKETQDRELMGNLDIVDGRPRILPSGSWIYIEGNCPNTTYTIDVSDSFFSLECERVRPSMYSQ